MSDEFDDASGNEGEGIKSLRKEFEALKRANAEKDAALAKYQKQERQASVAGVLKAKGLPEKVASLYQGDDASEEAVGKWIEEFGDVFGIQQQKQNDAEQEQAKRVQNATFGSPDTPLDKPPAGRLVGDPSELLAQMKSLSYEQLVEQGLLPNVKGTLYDTHGR
jgi:hypothetical protein